MFHIVTGGNRGIGLELCKLLAKDHLNVILTSRDLSKSQAAAESIAQEAGGSGKILGMQLDLHDPVSI